MENIVEVVQKTEIELSSDPEVPYLHMYSQELKVKS
jgi:hypothetical protein